MARSNNPKLKKAFTEIEYTSEMLIEIKRCAEDPIYFCKNYIKIKHPTRGLIPFDLYDYQEDVLEKFQEHRLNIILSARQTGKSEMAAAYCLWYAIFHDTKNVMIVSNKGSNAMRIIEKIQLAYEELPIWLKPGIKENNWNKHTCEFENKSTIKSETTSEKSGRGESISLLFCLGGENTVKIRNKNTLVEEEITLENLFNRLYKGPEVDKVFCI